MKRAVTWTVERGVTLVIKYRLVVNGLGNVYDGASEEEAKRKFQLFVKQSKKRRSKSVPRLVTLFKNYEIVREYQVPEPELS